MLFNSFHFLVFFPVAVAVHFALSQQWRWLWLLLCSYYFYMAWHPLYGGLLAFTTVLDYYMALLIHSANNQYRRRLFLVLSIVSNIGFLLFFKYANFFNWSLRQVFKEFHAFFNIPYHDFLLPIGISFYVFQSLSYTIDVYRKRIEPERHIGKFALFVSFFPQLVAGPIERAASLLPQLNNKPLITAQNIRYGLKLMFWGYFQKIVIADNLGVFADALFANPQQYAGITAVVGVLFFAVQIYCDFSGYSDIARGAAAIMGYKLMINFRQPYFATSLTVFWRRWHISLSDWFKDYVYTSLGGNRNGVVKTARNILISFLLSGLWHGADWNFVLWGLWCGGWVAAEHSISGYWKKHVSYNWIRYPRILFTFVIICWGWIFFRAHSVQDAWIISANILDVTLWHKKMAFDHVWIIYCFVLCALVAVTHYIERKHDLVSYVQSLRVPLRWSIYIVMGFLLLTTGNFNIVPFLYFQF